MTENQTIDYDSKIIPKIKEMINEGFDKLKSLAKVESKKITKNPNFKLYEELEKKFDEISFKLKELKLCNEYIYFLLISDYILYIVHRNSIDSNFGHCDLAIELLDFFMEIFTTNVNFYNNSLKITDEEFETLKIHFKKQYWKYRSQFYCDIYQPTGDFSEEEMYEIHKSLRSFRLSIFI